MRWRIREEAVAATADPKRREGIAAGARQIRKTEAPWSALKAKCSSPAVVLVTSKGKVIWQKRARR
jgi:hypothetical protein